MQRLVVGLLLATSLACARSDAKPAGADTVVALGSSISRQCEMIAAEHDTTCILFGPSLIALIARPELYDGKRVRLAGFANVGFEDNGLYVSHDDFEQMIARNGVWIDVPESLAGPYRSKLPGYFVIEGTFVAGKRGHFGMWSGSIQKVSRFFPVLTRTSIDSARRRTVNR